MEIAGGLFQIVMAQQNLNSVQVSAGLEHVRGEAVTEHVGIHLLLHAGTASSVLAGVTRRFRIDGLITTMPTVSGEEPNGFFALTATVGLNSCPTVDTSYISPEPWTAVAAKFSWDRWTTPHLSILCRQTATPRIQTAIFSIHARTLW